MTQTNDKIDRLYQLLPAIYRQRDAETGWQLKALLRVIAEQVNVVEADIAQLYENWFIETCQDWVVPYIGDLIGYQQVHEAGELGEITTPQEQQRNKILISRSEVANTIHYRRRRGTLALLEQLAKDVAGWPSHAVEFYKQVGVTQNANYRRLERGRTMDIRDNRSLYYLDSPFGKEGHTVDVRRIISRRATGRYNLPSVGLFVWRLRVYSLTKATAYCEEEVGTNCYTFSVLGNDVPLYTKPVTTGPVDELHFPNPIGLRAFEKRLLDYYGEDKSLYIWTHEDPARTTIDQHSPSHEEHGQHGQHGHHDQHRHGHQEQHGQHGQQGHHFEEHHGPQLVPKAQQPAAPAPPTPPTSTSSQSLIPVLPYRIIAADLSDWKKYRPAPGKVAVDPTRGRIVFPPGHQPREVFVTYHNAFSTGIGGGEYTRPILQPTVYQLYRVGQHENEFSTIQKALDKWNEWKAQNAQKEQPEPYNAVIEITDNRVYTEQLEIELEEYENLQIRAANQQRPVIRLVDWNENLPDSLKVSGEFGSRFTLDGLLITGRSMETEGIITRMTLRHCTLVPGWDLDANCKPHQPAEPSLSLYHVGEQVTIEHSIIGSLVVSHDEVREDPLKISISDSILDATDRELTALSTPEDGIAHALLTITRCTVIGRMLVHALELGENSIFWGRVTVARRQIGCMRFCSVPYGSRTPSRYNCQSDLVEQAVETKLKLIPKDEREAAKLRERNRVQPLFKSTRYGQPTYCQLALACAIEIRHGADDESEMGVFHDLYQPQREANLRVRLDDFTPADMEAGIIYLS